MDYFKIKFTSIHLPFPSPKLPQRIKILQNPRIRKKKTYAYKSFRIIEDYLKSCNFLMHHGRFTSLQNIFRDTNFQKILVTIPKPFPLH